MMTIINKLKNICGMVHLYWPATPAVSLRKYTGLGCCMSICKIWDFTRHFTSATHRLPFTFLLVQVPAEMLTERIYSTVFPYIRGILSFSFVYEEFKTSLSLYLIRRNVCILLNARFIIILSTCSFLELYKTTNTLITSKDC